MYRSALGRRCSAAPPSWQHLQVAWPASSRQTQLQQPRPSRPRRAARVAAAAAEPAGAGAQQAPPPAPAPPSLQKLAAAARTPAAFAALLRRLCERGSGATEEHLVAAWAAQRRTATLHPPPPGRQWRASKEQQAAVLEALVALEELTRQQLVALAPDQLGFVARCYVLAGGNSKPLLLALQQAACGWRGEDYGPAGLGELAWVLASCGQPLAPGCRQLLCSALGADGSAPGGGGGDGAEAAAGAAEQPQRDWAAWFDRAPASRVVLLLWSAARLGLRPCAPCLEAAAAALLRFRGIARLPTKSLVTLLWSLATLRVAQQPQLQRGLAPLLEEATLRLSERMEAALGASSDSSWEEEEDKEGEQGGWPVPPSGYAEGAASTDLSGVDDEGSSVLASALDDELDGRSGEQPAAAAWYSGRAGAGDSGGSSSRGDGRSGRDGLPAARSVAAELPAGTLCMAVWACGQLHHSDARMLRAATTLLHGRVDQMAPADIARLLWGLGQLGFCPALLLGTIGSRLQARGELEGFEPHQLAMVTYAFAALDFFPGQDCVDALADAALRARAALEPRALAHVLWNMSRLGYVDDPFYAAFVPVILLGIGQYGPAELADVARVYSRCSLNPCVEDAAAGSGGSGFSGFSGEGEGEGEGAGPATLFGAIARQTVARIQGADIQDILRIMTAFHQMGLQPEELLGAVEAWANQRLRALSPQALSLALWSFARMGSSSPGLLETATACAEQQLAAFNPPQLAKVAWSFAKLGWPAPRVLRHAGATLAASASAFSDKEASNVLWALASQGEALEEGALERIAASLQPRLRAFGPQSLANIAWAYATLRRPPGPAFLRHLGDAALPQLHVFEPQGLSLLVWALASLGHRHNRLFNEIVRLCGERPSLLRQFEGQHLANLLWGLVRSGFRPAPPFLLALAKEAELRVCDLKPQELFNIAWAFTQLGHHPRRLFDAVAREVVPRAFAFTPQELSGTLWALARAQHGGRAVPALLHAVEREVAARGASFEDRHLAILCWSYGQLGHVPPPDARPPLLALAAQRAPAMTGRSLATMVAGLAAMEQQRRWLQRRQWQDEAEEGGASPQLAQSERPGSSSAATAGDPAPATAAAATAAVVQAAAAEAAAVQAAVEAEEDAPLVPRPLVAALAGRAEALLPRLQPFETAQLVHGLAVVGSEQAASIFFCSASPQTAAQLQAAAREAPLPVVVGMLWAMARCGCYPEPTFDAVCRRLRETSPHYRLPQPALAVLGEALLAMPAQQREAARLRKGLAFAAKATARAVALHGPPGALATPGSGAGSGTDSGPDSDSEAAYPAEVRQPLWRLRQRQLLLRPEQQLEEQQPDGQQEQEQQEGQRHASMLSPGAAPAAPQPDCSNDNQEPGWLEMTYDDLTSVM